MKSIATLTAGTAAALTFLIAADSRGQDREEESGVLPVPPRELWAPMPGKLKTWKLLRSTAENRLGGWVESRAVREYEKIIPPDESSEASEPEIPGKTRIVITDTGKHPSAIGHFANFSVEAEPEEEAVTPRMVKSWPAYQIRYGKQDQVLEILVAGRFLVEISVQNQPERFLDEWVRRIDLDALARIPETEKVPLPELLIMVKVDQLNPAKNGAYHLATTSNSRVEDELVEDEEWLAEVIGEVPEIPEEDEP